MTHWTQNEGSPHPLGITRVPADDSYNFALYSKHATGVVLHLYGVDDPSRPLHSERLDYLTNKSGRMWHCRLPGELVDGASYYAYTVEGPLDLNDGHRFDPAKILLDPYARMTYFPPDHSRVAASSAGSNAGRAPLGLIPLLADTFDWGDDRRPRHEHDAVIYEMHVRGFTRRQNSGIPEAIRGTYLGVIEKIPYLQELGITVVELLPVYQFDPLENNYWGYMTLGFFSPHNLYATNDNTDVAVREFKEMVKALHQADIEVVLDVVYNHTTEGGKNGPTYSFRGIDNTTYYLLGEDRQSYIDDTGTGNMTHTANRYVRTLVVDSLRYWVQEMHVDGFRFDLASIFTRRSDGSIDIEDPPIISAIRNDPLLVDARLIAEAWDMGSYQLGRTFPGITWQQWNGKFRDDIRSFIKGDEGMINALMARLYGSDDLFPDDLLNAYHAFQSINFVTSHDGFSLYDLVSYNNKNNYANGQGNTDGTDDNRSWNCGWEGNEGVPQEVLELRNRQIKNFVSLLMLANGTPMFHSGDEFGNTQGGNNNPYNQDNETTWLDWALLNEQADIFRFFRTMIAFRNSHPSLGRSRFWREDVTWYGVVGEPDRASWSRALAFALRGSSENDIDMYVMINAWWEPLEFQIQEGQPGQWSRVVDTALQSPLDIAEPGNEIVVDQRRYDVRPRSVVVLTSRE